MKESAPKRLTPWLLAAFVLVAIAAAITLIRSFTRDVVEVRVSPVTHENLISQVSTNGKVEPIEIFQAHSPIAGVVEKVYVKIGEKVKAGQPLIEMEDAEAKYRLAAAQTSLLTAKANAEDIQDGGNHEENIILSGELTRSKLQVTQAQASLDTLKQLQAKGAASAAEVASAQDRLAATQSALQTAQSRVSDRYGSRDLSRSHAMVTEMQSSYDAALHALNNVSIKAPFAGTVYALPVSDFDFVPGGESLIDVANLNKIHIRAYFDEPEIGKLSAGEPVRIVWDARPNRVWHGHVEVAPTTVITYGTRNVGECIITVDDADGELLPNTNVTVTVTYSQRFNVLSIPREALHTDGSINYVFRVVNHHLQRTLVQIGASNLTRVEITSGLSEKDVVALNSTSNRDLTNGLEVRTVE